MATNADITDGYLYYQVGFTLPPPVTNESVVLIQITFLNTTTSVTQVTIGPCNQNTFPCVYDLMWFTTGDFSEPPYDIINIMYPVSGSHETPVFIFNGEAVAVENESFGSVKALYR